MVKQTPVDSQTTPVHKQKRWQSLSAMGFALICENADGGLVNTLFPVIRSALGLGVDALGILASVSRFARMIFGPLWSMAADRFGRKRVLVFVTGGWGLWTATVGLAQNFEQLVLLYAIGVIGIVAGEPIANGLLADLFDQSERGKAFGTLRSLASAGSVVLTPLIGQLANVPNGWRIGMFVMGGLSGVSGLLILFLVHEPPRQKTESKSVPLPWEDVWTLVKTPTFLLLAGMLPLVTSVVLIAFLVTFFVDVRGWSNSDAAILYTTFQGGWMISSFFGGLIGDAFHRRFGPNGRVLLMQVYLAAYSVVSYLFLQMDWGRGAAIYAIAFFFGLIGSVGFSGAVLPMVSAIAPARLTATAFALLFSLIQGFLSAMLSLAMGRLAKAYGLEAVMLWMVTIPYAVNAIYWFLFYPFYPRDVRTTK